MKPASVKKIKTATHTSLKDNSFAVVAIGASAGGLEAVTQLLKYLPANTGMAFIYVQHLSPTHKSILTSILAKLTLMRVQEVKNKMLIEPNNLYVIPSDKEMVVIDGHIKLTPRIKGKIINMPIDAFFCSLANKHKEGAIGVVLSGNGNDGTVGLNTIKQARGLTFVQDDSAKFNSMPQSAIAAGAVDFVLSPKEIALELLRLSKHDYINRAVFQSGKEDEIDNSNADLKVILNLLHEETGVDFSHYKMATIKRRILRRMFLYKIKTLKAYAKQIKEKKDEINLLYQDLLINVTSFFRDTAAHQYLKTTLLPKLLKSKTANENLRVWVTACSTGEEAYSIAMAILEIQHSKSINIPVQIFASDLSKHAIAKARTGLYNLQQLALVPPKTLQRFFTKNGNNYRIAKEVRDMCVFAPHNILRDPPFSRVDFISCCNLLIYLETAAQKKAITTFHYALNDGGYLMLGKSETTGASSHLFARVDAKLKIYQSKTKIGVSKLPEILPIQQQVLLPQNNISNKLLKNVVTNKDGFGNAIDAVLIANYMPATVVINHAMEVLQFRGAMDAFLTYPSGKASLNILKMTYPEIAFELRTAISKAIKTKKAISKIGIDVKTPTQLRIVTIKVVPINIDFEEPLLLILFTEPEQIEVYAQQGVGATKSDIVKDRRIKKLEEELFATRADMRDFTQEQETFNQELQSANEEIVSSNEELQSVNEELETSKEEIESTNEELITTNQELQTRNDLLNESYDYSEAIIATIHEPMIILDKKLRVKSANKSFYKNFGVTVADTEGVLLYDLGNKQWNIPRLRELLEGIISQNTHINDFEVANTFPGIGQKIMLLNASRIVQKSHGVQLVLLAIKDITEIRMTTLELQVKEKALFDKNVSERKAEKQKLQKAVDERTKELKQVNKELVFQNGEKEQRAEELTIANKELVAFTYVSSHDLQEPLRKIQTFVNRILEKEEQNLSTTGKDYFNRIQASAKRMRQLIEDLLAYSRTNITERKFEKVDLNEIIQEVNNDLKELIEEKHAIVESCESCELNVIPFQFKQMLDNLIRNALKFSNTERLPHIIVSCSIQKGSKLYNEKLSAKKSYCHIYVKDNGIGFDPEYKDRIFEVFQRLHNREEYEGTGIGLAIVKKIVENHNGIITATGQLDKGATFNIYIPISGK